MFEWAPHVQMLYWNITSFKFLYHLVELHMYKCCIEIHSNTNHCRVSPSSTCTNVVLKYRGMDNITRWAKLHMYKCCIEIRFKFCYRCASISSTCTNVVLKCLYRSFLQPNRLAPHVQMLYWNLSDQDYKNLTEIAPHVQMLYWNKVLFCKST